MADAPLRCGYVYRQVCDRMPDQHDGSTIVHPYEPRSRMTLPPPGGWAEDRTSPFWRLTPRSDAALDPSVMAGAVITTDPGTTITPLVDGVALARGIEAEWYNGNIDERVRDRLLAGIPEDVYMGVHDD